MPTTMLLRLAVVPLRLVIVALPFVVLPARLKVIGLECARVRVRGLRQCHRLVLPLIDETVVAGEVRMPLLELVTTIPVTTQVLAVLPTEVTVVLPLVQVPVVVTRRRVGERGARVPAVGSDRQRVAGKGQSRIRGNRDRRAADAADRGTARNAVSVYVHPRLNGGRTRNRRAVSRKSRRSRSWCCRWSCSR